MYQVRIDDDEGWMDVAVAGLGGPPGPPSPDTPRRLDVVLEGYVLLEIARECEGKPSAEYWARLKAWAEGAGFPGVTTRTADAVAAAVLNRMAELRARDNPAPVPAAA